MIKYIYNQLFFLLTSATIAGVIASTLNIDWP